MKKVTTSATDFQATSSSSSSSSSPGWWCCHCRMSPWCHCPPYHHENHDTTLHSRPFDPLPPPPPPPPLRTIRPGPVVQQQHINNDHSHNQFRDPYSHRRPSKPNPVHHPTSQNHHHHHSQYPKLWILSSSLERRTMGVLMALTFLISIVINVDYRLNHYLQTISQSILFNNSCSTTKTTRSSSSRGNIRKHPSNENDERKSSVSPLHDKTLAWDNDQFPHAWLAYEQQQQQQQHELEPHFEDVDVTTRNSTTMMIPKPPYMILLTEYGWNHPNPKRGLTFARSIRSTEYVQSIVNHPYFHPTAYHEIMIAQTRSVDPNMTYYVFLDIETCYETNYPHYRKSYRGNCDRTGSRMYYSYTYIKHRRPPTAACYNLDDPQCHYIPTEIYTNPIFTHPNTITKNNTNKLVVLDCRGNGPNVLFRKKSPGNSTALALVSLSSTAQQLNGQIDQGLPPPSIQTIPYRTTTTTTTTTSTSSMSQYDQEISCDCHSFLEPTNDTTTTHDENVMPPLNRKYLLSFSGDYRRHAVRHELAKLDTVQSSTSLRDPAATPIIAEQKRPLVLITDSKELYHSTNGLSYSELLLSSQYVAVPRGDNLFSYRFSEVLSSGAIPVLIHNTEWILPFRPEIVQWDRCVIRITAQEINTTVTILQNISSYEQCQRRQYCYYVYETYMKNSSASIQGILDGLQAITV